jgi:hypothetical protein
MNILREDNTCPLDIRKILGDSLFYKYQKYLVNQSDISDRFICSIIYSKIMTIKHVNRLSLGWFYTPWEKSIILEACIKLELKQYYEFFNNEDRIYLLIISGRNLHWLNKVETIKKYFRELSEENLEICLFLLANNKHLKWDNRNLYLPLSEKASWKNPNIVLKYSNDWYLNQEARNQASFIL